MRNILFTSSFDGTRYHGWQVQENAVTVQQTVQDSFEQITCKRGDIIGCSRTDASVHANMYCFNIRTECEMPCSVLKRAMNAVLPRDIAVFDCKEVPLDFHARYSCKSKEYIYKIWNCECKNPFLYNYSLHWQYPLDCEFLDLQAKDFIGKYDYSSFCSAGSSVENKVRNVIFSSVFKQGNTVIFKVEADGFLYNMVRIMVGTLLDISAGKINPGSVKEIIEAKNRNMAGITVPGKGLYLNRVNY
ncbi:MAG: tRNA pseudouridine(38-40) synthase TruA [Clostridiales bacterium]|nr:tRNA pseudouridine(38-40) synthase TruA [Clostridiales bacterium]